MATVLITGAGKGIGLEFAKQYTAAGWDVIATHRGSGSDALRQLASDAPGIRLEVLDVDDLASIDDLAARLADVAIDVLINNAGRMGDGNDPTAQFGERIGSLKYDLMDQYFKTNTRGPIKMIEAFHGHVKASSHKKMVTISSGAGSFAMPGPPGLVWYKASKAAVNMLMVNAARTFQADGITVLTFHPGLVLTERLAPMRDRIMNMPGQEKPFESKDAVAGMIAAISAATLEDSGRFMGNQGQTIAY